MIYHIYYFIRRWQICCLLFFVFACNPKTRDQNYTDKKVTFTKPRLLENYQKIERSKHLIQDGDLILRTGNDFTSDALRRLSNQDKTYSHCGIAVVEGDSLFIYHALGGEWNPDERLRKDPLNVFCSPIDNKGFGIFHFDLTETETYRLDSIITSWYKKGVTFDMNFDLATDDKMYCAEFVSKAVSCATANRITFSKTQINDFSFIAIDNLHINPNCEQKIRYTFDH